MIRYTMVSGDLNDTTGTGFQEMLNATIAQLTEEGAAVAVTFLQPTLGPRGTFLVSALEITDLAGPAPAADRAPVTVKEAAKLTGFSENLIYTQIRDGKIAAVRLGRSPRIPAYELDRLTGIAR